MLGQVDMRPTGLRVGRDGEGHLAETSYTFILEDGLGRVGQRL